MRDEQRLSYATKGIGVLAGPLLSELSLARSAIPSYRCLSPRNPQLSDYCRCVKNYFETFVRIYDKHFSRQYGFRRPYLEKVVYRTTSFVATGTTVLPVSNARTAAPNFYWHFLVRAATSAPPVTRSEWWNSGSGSA